MFQINSEVISIHKFKLSGGKFNGTGVADMKVSLNLVKVRGEEELQIHSTYEFYSDSEGGGSLEFEARGMITVKDPVKPTASELYEVLVYHAGRVFDILIGNCKVEKVSPPEKPDINMFQEYF